MQLNKGKADCQAYYENGYRKNGPYEIQPSNDPNIKFSVYCDMDLGGWTMIMRREANDPKTIFNRPFDNYKTGFGDLAYSHWLGKRSNIFYKKFLKFSNLNNKFKDWKKLIY